MAISPKGWEAGDAEHSTEVSNLSGDGKPRRAFLAAWMSHPCLYLFMLAFTLRTAVAISLTNVFSGSLVLDDQTYWGEIAADIARGTTETWSPYIEGLYERTRAFSLPLGVVYKLFDGNQLSGQLLVATAGAGLSVVVFLIARELFGKTSLALVPGLLVALLPSQVLWSSLVLKDSFVWFGLACLTYAFIRLARVHELKRIVLLIVLLGLSLFLLAFLRAHTTVVAAWSLLLASCFVPRLHRALKIIGVASVSVLIPWIAGLGLLGVPFALSASPVTTLRDANAVGAQSAIITPPAETMRRLTLRQTELEKELLEAETGPATEQRAERADELRAELSHVEALIAAEQGTGVVNRPGAPAPTDPSRRIGVRYVARGVSVMLLEPYPWDPSTSPSFTMAKLEGIVWYPVVFLVVIGSVRAFRHWRLMLLPVLLGFGTMLLYALTEGNVGTAFRHRGEFVWVIALLAAFGVSELVSRRAGWTSVS